MLAQMAVTGNNDTTAACLMSQQKKESEVKSQTTETSADDVSVNELKKDNALPNWAVKGRKETQSMKYDGLPEE